jgi:hypothetical protein
MIGQPLRNPLIFLLSQTRRTLTLFQNANFAASSLVQPLLGRLHHSPRDQRPLIAPEVRFNRNLVGSEKTPPNV